jgi:thiol-disulfide isomerase/thioredoxin
MTKTDACELIATSAELEEIIRTKERLFVLFYASWCPFSRMFLPVFVDHAEKGEPCYRRILVDQDDELVEKYRIDIYPTVLFFRKGKLAKRLDGTFHVGLNKGQLEEFVGSC